MTTWSTEVQSYSGRRARTLLCHRRCIHAWYWFRRADFLAISVEKHSLAGETGLSRVLLTRCEHWELGHVCLAGDNSKRVDVQTIQLRLKLPALLKMEFLSCLSSSSS